MNRGIIDRYEGTYVVVEIDSKLERFDRKDFPPGAKEGDSVIFQEGRVLLDPVETARRKEQMQQLMDKLFVPRKKG